MQFFIKRGEKIQGPFTQEQLIGFVNSNQVSMADLVSNFPQGPFHELHTVWQSIMSQISHINPQTELPAQSQTIQPQPMVNQMPVQQVNPAFLYPTQMQPSRPKKTKAEKKKEKEAKNKKRMLIWGISGGVVGLALVVTLWITIFNLGAELKEEKAAQKALETAEKKAKREDRIKSLRSGRFSYDDVTLRTDQGKEYKLAEVVIVEESKNSNCQIMIAFADKSYIQATWKIDPDISNPPFKVTQLDNQAKNLYGDTIAFVIVKAALFRFQGR
ncbi:MAG: hypothetical protein VX768_11850 [Planctomycetota bacterium]|nr:hypothetical protein [Planctomycetota bacterium]